MVLDIDEERRRISLGLKQCKTTHGSSSRKPTTRATVLKVKSSLSLTSVSSSARTAASMARFTCLTSHGTLQAKKQFVNTKKGDEIAAVVLQVDAERERISTGVKQLAEDPFNNWVALNKKGAIVNGKVTAVDAKGATVELADGVEGYLRASEASRDRVEDATLVLSVGDDVEAKFTGVDRKNRAISLSVRAKDEADEKDAIATVNKQEDANFSNNAMAEAFKAAKGE